MVSLVTQGIFSLEKYQEKYRFTNSVEALGAQMQEYIINEPFKIRRRVWERELGSPHAFRELVRKGQIIHADFVNFHIAYRERGDGSKFWVIDQNELYGGGVEKPLLVGRHLLDRGRKTFYTGPLPTWVQTRYSEARELWSPDELMVVSRNKAFFEVEVVRACPLLLGLSRHVPNFQVLIAAWGMEYELP